MDTLYILNNINLNFNKLLVSCNDGYTFTPPTFQTSSDIDALIVLYQILHITHQAKHNNNISNTLLNSTLYHIINIKCQEFTDTKQWKNLDNFINSFVNYVNSMNDTILFTYNSNTTFN